MAATQCANSTSNSSILGTLHAVGSTLTIKVNSLNVMMLERRCVLNTLLF